MPTQAASAWLDQDSRPSCARVCVCNAQAGSAADPLWQVACNYSSPLFGTQPLVVHDGRLQPRDVEQGAEQSEEDSPFCELLGPQQRAWLESTLAARTAPVKLIASGSVVFGSTGLQENSADNEWTGRCSGETKGGVVQVLG